MFVFLPTETFSPTSHETSTEQSPVSSTKQIVTTTYKPTVVVSTTSEGETVPTVVYETTTTTQQDTTPLISEETTPVLTNVIGTTTEIPSHETTVQFYTTEVFQTSKTPEWSIISIKKLFMSYFNQT